MDERLIFKRGQIVKLAEERSTGNISYRVEHVHRDGTLSVEARFFLDVDGKEVPGYLGYHYRVPSGDFVHEVVGQLSLLRKCER